MINSSRLSRKRSSRAILTATAAHLIRLGFGISLRHCSYPGVPESCCGGVNRVAVMFRSTGDLAISDLLVVGTMYSIIKHFMH